MVLFVFFPTQNVSNCFLFLFFGKSICRVFCVSFLSLFSDPSFDIIWYIFLTYISKKVVYIHFEKDPTHKSNSSLSLSLLYCCFSFYYYYYHHYYTWSTHHPFSPGLKKKKKKKEKKRQFLLVTFFSFIGILFPFFGFQSQTSWSSNKFMLVYYFCTWRTTKF